MYFGLVSTGLKPFTVPVKGMACKEQTNRVSTATERSNAQNSWAPKSRDPCIVFDCFRKSSLETIVSTPCVIASCLWSE